MVRYASHNQQGTKFSSEVYLVCLFRNTTAISPSSIITSEELKAINLITSEDAVAYEPSLVIRRRNVGDPNGMLGIRGSGMFQTARSLAFADGLPVHYLPPTRCSGSPRWSFVGPDEIQTVEVIFMKMMAVKLLGNIGKWRTAYIGPWI